jgi:uncharacterized membrane protein
MGFYLMVGIIIALIAFRFPVYVAQSSTLSYALPLGILSAILIVLSPALSFVNLIVKRIKTGIIENVLELQYVDFFGIPIPVPKMTFREETMSIAVNIGGALVPLFVSITLFILMMYSPYSKIFYTALIVSLFINTLTTYFLAKPIKGVGIAVPAFIPPIISSIPAILIAGISPAAASAAYISGSMGSLLGADILHLAKEPEKIFAPLVSIGGAGIFDGVFITGLIAFVIAY